VPIGDKPGVPLSDVWDIPYLNPKAEERVGYPTQKPVLLLERIIELASNRGDSVLDPFCGSGTTLVAASLWERKHVGIDISEEAISLTSQRLLRLVKTRSNLLEKGRGSYNTANKDLLSVLGDLDYVPVHRNKGIDAILKQGSGKRPVLIRIQRDGETVEEAANLLVKASQKKEPGRLFLIVTTRDSSPTPPGVRLIETPKSQIKQLLS
jgi:site-specific DNA-methyltransferase (adenine-specific)